MSCWRIINMCRYDNKEPTFENLLEKATELIASEGFFGIMPERLAAMSRHVWKDHFDGK